MLMNAYSGFGAGQQGAATEDGDRYWDMVWSLLHFNDNVTDQKGLSWTGSTPVYDTGKFGKALKISTGNTYISSPPPSGNTSILNTQDFTCEFWFKTTNASAGCDILYVSMNGNGFSNLNLYLSGGNLKFRSSNAGTAWNIDATVTALVADTFIHIAMVRTGSNFVIYIDGVGAYTTSSLDASFSYLAGTGIRIGTYGLSGTASLFFDDFRLTVGARRYTAPFTPPTAPFFDYGVSAYDPFFSSVTSLLQFDSDFTDVKGVTWTGFGNAAVSGGDLVLDGSGDLLLANSSLSVPANTKGCVEFFATVTQSGDGNYHAICSSNSGSGSRWVLSVDTGNNLAIFTSASGAWNTTGFTLANVQNVRKHFAISTDGAGVIRLAVDGVWGTARTGSLVSTATGAIIGRMDTSIDLYYCALSMGAWRVTSGMSRYGLGVPFTAPSSFKNS